MCTMIAQQVKIDGSGKGTGGWFTLREANVSYDHPYECAAGVRAEYRLCQRSPWGPARGWRWSSARSLRGRCWIDPGGIEAR